MLHQCNVWEWEWEGMGKALWESHGNGNWLQNWEWEWEGMGIHCMGMGGSGNVKSHSRAFLLSTLGFGNTWTNELYRNFIP